MQPGPDLDLEPALDRLISAAAGAREADPASLESLWEQLDRVNHLANEKSVEPERFQTVRSKIDRALSSVSEVLVRLREEQGRIGSALAVIDDARNRSEPGARLNLTL